MVPLAYAIAIGRTGLYIFIPLLMIPVLLSSLKLRPVLRINLALCGIGIVTALYGAEVYLTLAGERHSGWKAAKSFDDRSPLQVVTDLRRSGIDACPSLFGRLPSVYGKPTLTAGAAEILPLGGISGRLTVLCNEAGEYVTYVGDEHGFNNPDGIWIMRDMTVVALGDSFTQGTCVPGDRGFVALIRGRYPATLNLGMSGNGPLFELAALEEYAHALRPRIVLWFFFEANDLVDLGDERSNPLLVRYLEDGFSQGLMQKQRLIDESWEGFAARLQSDWADSQKALPFPEALTWFNDVLVEHRNRTALFRILRLRELRLRLAARLARPEAEEEQVPMLAQVLRKANATVASWGGRLNFVFLPGMELLLGRNAAREHLSRRVLDEVRGLNIPALDLRRDFRSHNTSSLFYYPDSHYNESGNRIVAEAVIAFLQEETGEARNACQPGPVRAGLPTRDVERPMRARSFGGAF